MRTVDAAIVGAGPAGSVAAALLARAGRRVALIEAEPPPGPDAAPKIGETLPAAADRLLRAHGLPAAGDDPAHRPIAGAVTLWDGPGVSPVQRTDGFADPEGPSLRLDRRRFDAALRAAALAAGARPVTARVRRVERTPDGWRLPGLLKAAWLIDATGRAARVARSLGAEGEREPAQIALWAVGAAPPADRTPVDRTLIEREADGAGWWYGARLPDGRPLAALHTDARDAAWSRADPARWRARLAATQLLAETLDASAFETAPLHAADARGGRLLRPIGPGWLACGDAALHVDPIASQGIFNALAGGVSVARTLTADDVDGAMAAYGTRLADVWTRYRLRQEALSVRSAAG